ncbi:MAG: hypothetical protein M5R36_29570 [Deltaproteobacteria bacterium]|nr:hypothetical protein [Deltaproteobacteria bacterium]
MEHLQRRGLHYIVLLIQMSIRKRRPISVADKRALDDCELLVDHVRLVLAKFYDDMDHEYATPSITTLRDDATSINKTARKLINALSKKDYALWELAEEKVYGLLKALTEIDKTTMDFIRSIPPSRARSGRPRKQAPFTAVFSLACIFRDFGGERLSPYEEKRETFIDRAFQCVSSIETVPDDVIRKAVRELRKRSAR